MTHLRFSHIRMRPIPIFRTLINVMHKIGMIFINQMSSYDMNAMEEDSFFSADNSKSHMAIEDLNKMQIRLLINDW